MSGIVAVCAILAVSAAPVPPFPVNEAPPPRLVRPDLSLIVIEIVSNADETNRARIHRVGFRNGKVLAAEAVWEGDRQFLTGLLAPQLVGDRLLVFGRGGVIDLDKKKAISSEQDGWVEHIDDKRVIYRIESNSRPEGLFSFEYATGTVTCIAKPPVPKPWHRKLPSSYSLSPDHKHAIRWEAREELVLHREGGKPTSLGKGFKMEEDPQLIVLRSLDLMYFPVLWLDNDTFLTQRGHGNLVTVDLVGKVSEGVTIKDVPKLASPSLTRDRSGTIFYSIGGEHYRIDLAKKTAEKSEWYELGHGFEASWEAHDKFGYKLRHNGKDIGQFHCWARSAKVAPGYIAVVASDGQERFFSPRRVAVWSAATGEWTSLDYDWLWSPPLAGWVK